MNTLRGGLIGVLLAGGIAVGQDLNSELLRRASVIKPRPEELKWQKIPWVTDLVEGQRLALAERRPIFLVAFADGPLERV